MNSASFLYILSDVCFPETDWALIILGRLQQSNLATTIFPALTDIFQAFFLQADLGLLLVLAYTYYTYNFVYI